MDQPIKAQKRPMVVECMQYTGTNLGAIEAWIGSHNVDLDLQVGPPLFWVEKSKRWVGLKEGMWVMKEHDGSGYYPCAAEAFDASYDKMED